MSTSHSSGNSTNYDVNISKVHYPPGTLLTHPVKCVLKHEGIALGNFADLQRSCLPAHVCPGLWKVMAENPDWTFVLHNTQDGVLIVPLGKAMQKNMQSLGDDHLAEVLWWRLYTLAEVFAYDKAMQREYSILSYNCHQFLRKVLDLVAPAVYVQHLLDRHAEVSHKWTSSVSCAGGVAIVIGLAIPAVGVAGAVATASCSLWDAFCNSGRGAPTELVAAQQELGAKKAVLSGMKAEGASAKACFAKAELWCLDAEDKEMAESPRWSLLRRARAPPREGGEEPIVTRRRQRGGRSARRFKKRLVAKF